MNEKTVSGRTASPDSADAFITCPFAPFVNFGIENTWCPNH
jgi:hypothetical protein